MNTDFNLFLAVLYFCFSVVVLIILLLFLVGIFDKEAPRILVKFLSYVLKFIHTIGYFPIMQVFFGVSIKFIKVFGMPSCKKLINNDLFINSAMWDYGILNSCYFCYSWNYFK